MVNSELLSTILRGQWFLSPQEADGHLLLVQSLLNRSEEVFKPGMLSDRNPIPHFLSSISGVTASSEGNSFDAAPDGSVAVVPISGVMTKNGTWCSYGTAELAAVIREAADAPNIVGVRLDCDSGGGSVDSIAPIIDALNYLHAQGKSSVALVDSCASACYYAAVHCNEVYASNSISSCVGSIGVMISFTDYAAYHEKFGIKQHTVYSDLSGHKNAAFEAALKGEYDTIKEEMLNPLALKFQEAVKANRKKLDCSVEGILSGKMFFADDAVKYGMLDGIMNAQDATKRIKELRSDACINNYINSKG